MLYNLNSEIDRSKYKKRSEQLLEKRDIVELKAKKPRTSNQNSYLHLILGWFASEYGASNEHVKQKLFKVHVNPDIFEIVVQNKINGKEFTDLRSSKDLDTVEMTKAIDRFRNWSGQNGIYLPEANEKDFLREIEVQINNNRF